MGAVTYKCWSYNGVLVTQGPLYLEEKIMRKTKFMLECICESLYNDLPNKFSKHFFLKKKSVLSFLLFNLSGFLLLEVRLVSCL